MQESESLAAHAEATPSASKEIMVNADERGIFTFRNHKELGHAASMLIKMSLAPQHLREAGQEAVAAAIVLCKQFNLPQKAMNQMGFVEGRLTCYGSLNTALAERHPQYGEQKCFYITEAFEERSVANKNLKEPVWAAVVRSRKKGTETWNEFIFSVEDMQLAGLGGPTKSGKKSVWQKYLKDMLMHKALARCYRTHYASALEGIDYHEDMMEAIQGSSPKDVTPSQNSDELAERLARRAEGHKGDGG